MGNAHNRRSENMTKRIPGKLYDSQRRDNNGRPIKSIAMYLEAVTAYRPMDEEKREPVTCYECLIGDKIYLLEDHELGREPLR